MRILFLLLTVAAASFGQVPRIGAIEFYGREKVPQEKLLAALGAQPGDRLPASKGDVEERLETVPGVVRANLEAVCCEDGKAILFVGIQEPGSTVFEVRDPPTGDQALSSEIVDAYNQFLDAFSNAARGGNLREDISRGYSLAMDPGTRVAQQRFIGLAELNLKNLHTVLHQSADAGQRAIAAYVIGYAPARKAVVDDLQYAMHDADPAVRSNAARALNAMAVLSRAKKDPELTVTPTWYVEMLNSLLWRERTEAAKYLLNFTDAREADALDQIKRRALVSVLEMADWKSLEYALPAYLLAGRVAGIDEKELQDAWSQGRRDEMLEKIRKALKK